MATLISTIILLISGTISLGAILLARLRKRSGIQLFLIRLFLGATTSMMFALAALAASITDAAAPKEPYGAELRLVLTLAAVLALALPLLPLLLGLFSRTLILQPIELPKRSGSYLRFAHLSDLHLTADQTIEHALRSDGVRSTCQEALLWALQSADIVFITGDVTDSGSPEEWEVYKQILHELDEADRIRILVVPGNHDLCIPPFTPTTLRSTDGYAFKGRAWQEDRSRDYVLNVLVECPDTWKLCGNHAGKSIAEVVSAALPYMKAYGECPPYFRRVAGPRGQSFTELVVPDSLNQLIGELPSGTVWPTKGSELYRDLIELAFPMVMMEAKNITVIGLNSCTSLDTDVLDNALGALGCEQLDRLADKLSSLPDDHTIVLLLHHHIGFPRDLMKQLDEPISWIKMKSLQLADAKELAAVLRKRNNMIVLHGHKHLPYHARFASGVVISAGSVSHSNTQTALPRCIIYGVQENGEIVMEDVLEPKAACMG